MRRSLVLLLLACAAPSTLRAQFTGNALVTLRLLPAITVTGTQDLDFGNIAPTQVSTVQAKNGGRFSVQGTASTPVVIQFTSLPASLGPNLALTGWTGLRNTVPGSGSATVMTPVPGGSLSATLAGTGRYYLWLGATLTASNAASGTYSVPVIITVVYN